MKIIPIALLLILSAPLAPAAKDKEKEKPTNNLPRVNTLLPQLLPRNPSAKPAPAAVQKQLDLFFNGIQAGKIDDSFRSLVANNPSLSDPAAVPEFVENIRKGLEVFGPLQGVELYDQRPVGTRVIYLTYLSFHTKKPLRWQFVYYMPVGADWKLLNLRFDDTVDQSLIPD
jgi:hypothetical protein